MNKFATGLLLILCLSAIEALSQEENPYSTWVKDNYPTTYTNIESMIAKVYGNENQKKFDFLVEYQAKALYNLFELLEKPDADWESFSSALTQWSQSDPTARSENWWEWPDTNWHKVESEYLFLIDTK